MNIKSKIQSDYKTTDINQYCGLSFPVLHNTKRDLTA